LQINFSLKLFGRTVPEDRGRETQGAGEEAMAEDSSFDTARSIRVFIASKVRLYREGLARLLGQQPRISVVGSGDLGEEIFSVLIKTVPDVLMLDVSGGEFSPGARLASQLPGIRILGLAVEDVEAQVIACAEAGLCGYVPCDASVEDLITALRRVAHGDTACSAAMAGSLFRHAGQVALGRPTQANLLTCRQQQIVQLINEGLSNKEIARRLSLGVSTVKNHVHNILDRLRVSRRAEAAARLRGFPAPRIAPAGPINGSKKLLAILATMPDSVLSGIQRICDGAAANFF
jgi:DNA-binding NarL/FixJ family response regulator